MKTELEDRLRNLIYTQCNTKGCNNCDLKFYRDDDSKCSATDLQDRIMDADND